MKGKGSEEGGPSHRAPKPHYKGGSGHLKPQQAVDPKSTQGSNGGWKKNGGC